MTNPILQGPSRRDKALVSSIAIGALATAFRYLGWLGLVLAFVGAVDVALRWYPTAFRSVEWEFATTSMTIASLPLLSIGAALLLISFIALDVRPGIAVMAAAFTLLALFVGALLVLFGLDVPVALGAPIAPGPRTELLKTVARTLLMGVAFLLLYAGGAAISFRHLGKRSRQT
jgi:hypothetical protein